VPRGTNSFFFFLERRVFSSLLASISSSSVGHVCRIKRNSSMRKKKCKTLEIQTKSQLNPKRSSPMKTSDVHRTPNIQFFGISLQSNQPTGFPKNDLDNFSHSKPEEFSCPRMCSGTCSPAKASGVFSTMTDS